MKQYFLVFTLIFTASISHAKLCVDIARAQHVAMDYLTQVEPGWNRGEVINYVMSLKSFDPQNDIQLHKSCYYDEGVYGDCFSKTRISYFARIPNNHLDMKETQRYLYVTCEGYPGIQNVFLY